MTGDRPDTDLRAGLRRLQPPEHRPGFWDDLAARLAEGGASEEATAPDGPTAPPREVPVLSDRRSPSARLRPWLLAAAAVVVVAVGLVAARWPGSTDDDVDVVDRPTPTTATTAPPPTSTPTSTAEAAAAAVVVVRAWVEALGTGDDDTAWALLAEPSREAVGGRDAFDAASGLREGYGAWAGVGDATFTATAASADAVVVTIVGERVAEGMPERRAVAVPVVREADGERRAAPLDPEAREIGLPWADGSPQPVPVDRPVLELVVPAGAETVVAVDGEAVPATASPGDGDREAVAVALDGRSGEVAVTVAAFLPDGAAVARAALVELP